MVVSGWSIRDARDGFVYVQGNGEIYQVVPGAPNSLLALEAAQAEPELVGRVIGMSGVYDIRKWTNGYHDDNIYFNNPVEYLPKGKAK